MLMEERIMINGGQRTIQSLGRISIKDLLDKNGLTEGDTVEIYIKKVVKS